MFVTDKQAGRQADKKILPINLNPGCFALSGNKSFRPKTSSPLVVSPHI